MLKYEQHLTVLNEKVPCPRQKWADLEMRTNAAKKKGITFEVKKKEEMSELEKMFARWNYVTDNRLDGDDLKEEIARQEAWL